MPYNKYEKNPFDDYQGYDQYGSDIEALMNRLIGQQKKIQATVKDEVDRTMAEMTILSDEINLKITSDDAESIFEQKAGSFTFNADQINFEGSVFGEDATFTGDIETEKNVLIGDRLFVGIDSEIPSKFIHLRGISGTRPVIMSPGDRPDDIIVRSGGFGAVFLDSNQNVILKAGATDPVTLDLDPDGRVEIKNANANGQILTNPFSQNLELYRDNSTGRIVVRMDGNVLGALAWHSTT